MPAESLVERLFNFLFSSMEGLAAVEIIILFSIAGMLFYARSIKKEIKQNAIEARESRTKIYTFIKSEMKELRESIDTRFKEVWASINDHNDFCSLKNQDAERWRGQVDEKLENLKERFQEMKEDKKKD